MRLVAVLLFQLVLLASMPKRVKLTEDMLLSCIYEGKLLTDNDWYGFIANVIIATTGRMTFQFRYPADHCCQNVLFYHDDQVSMLNSRMNCWQKENLLQPEDDQILKLNNRFSWSGCGMIHSHGVPMYICEGGRSFSNHLSDRPTTWYIAVSNCAAQRGLDLHYRLEIQGHIGECKNNYVIPSTGFPIVTPAHSQNLNPISSCEEVTNNKTVIKGFLNVTSNWYGFLANVSLYDNGGFKYILSYPENRQVENVILYYEEDIHKLNAQQSCWQKEGVIRAPNVTDQILQLSFWATWNGCVTQNTTGAQRKLVCEGERQFLTARNLYVAVNNCRSRSGVVLEYSFEFFGYEGNPCGTA